MLGFVMIRHYTILYYIPNHRCGNPYRFQPCLILLFLLPVLFLNTLTITFFCQ